MRIAVIGSWRPSEDEYKWRADYEHFAAACRELGGEFARYRQMVIVASAHPVTADRNVVDGVTAMAGKSADHPLIEVISPEEHVSDYFPEPEPTFEAFASEHTKLFQFPPVAERSWAATHLVRIRNADAVLSIGGAAYTYEAGLATIAGGKLLVPIGSFGGASAKLLQILHTLNAPFSDELNALNAPWSPHVLNAAAELLGIRRQPRLLLIHGHDPDRFQLVEWMRTSLGLNDVLIMQQEFGAGRSLPEKFEALARRADGAIALATPDDLGGPANSSQQLGRARQNVWLEIGWTWGRLGRNRLMVLCKGDVETPSDLQGLEYRYRTSPLEASESIRCFVSSLLGSRTKHH